MPDWFTENSPQQDWFTQNAPQPQPQGGSTTIGQKLAIGAATAVRIGGGLATIPAEALDVVPGAGTAVKAAIGAGVGAVTDVAAQAIEKAAGVRQKFSPAETGVAAGLMAIPLGELPRIGRAAQIGYRALQGAALGAGATQATSLLETGRPATLKETVEGGAIGGAFGGGGEFIAPKVGTLLDTVRGKEPPVTPQADAAAKEVEDASKITSATGVPIRPLREEMGGETSLQQQGKTAEESKTSAGQPASPSSSSAGLSINDIPSDARVTLNLKTATGEPASVEMDAREAHGIFTKEQSSYKALLDCLGG